MKTLQLIVKRLKRLGNFILAAYILAILQLILVVLVFALLPLLSMVILFGKKETADKLDEALTNYLTKDFK